MPTKNYSRVPDYMEAKGYLTDRERDTLHTLAGDVPRSGIIVNIGVQYGASVICLLSGRVDDSVRIIGVDIDPHPWQEMGYPAFDNLHLYMGDSKDLADNWGDRGKIDLLFVDGDHTYEGVKRDLIWTGLVAVGGTVVFHDCYTWPPEPPGEPRPVSPDVNRAVIEWTEESQNWREQPYADSMRIFRRVG